jgi:hypothetical protein
VSYDPLAESVRLLAGDPPSEVARVSRRVRFLPLAVDRDGDVAATMFLRRGVSGAALPDTHVLVRTAGRWRLLGGGGGPGDQAVLPRPGLAEIGAAVSPGAGGVARSSSGLLPWRRRDGLTSFAEIRAAREVAALRVGGRLVPVAGHGCAVVVWTRRPPRVQALDAAGTVLGEVPGAR